MPLKVKPPRPGKSPHYTIRGAHIGIKVDRSSDCRERAAAERVRRLWERQIERGEYADPRAVAPREAVADPTFADGVTAYVKAGGEGKFLEPILRLTGENAMAHCNIAEISQAMIDNAAAELYPDAAAATRNRQVYTPVSAVMKHMGIERKLRRPKGWRGSKRTFWLEPEPTFRLLAEADRIDSEFGIFCIMLNYCGLRLSEGLGFRCSAIVLERSFAYIPSTKTDEPRAVFLPPVVVAALASHPRGLARAERLFRFHNGSRLRGMLTEAASRAGITLPRRTAFHVFRHNYGTWMRRYGGLDDLGMVRTGVWADRDSVARYTHTETSEEARRAVLLPTPGAAPLLLTKKVG